MTEQERNKRIENSRTFIHWSDEEFESDQNLKRQQPPLVKEAKSNVIIDLPQDFSSLPMEADFVKILWKRKSNRVYTQEAMSVLQLSFLLWATQGVKSIRGNNYATLRTVPSGGARHPFETYLFVKNIDGLNPGFYHYLPLEHKLELLREADPSDEVLCKDLSDSACGQSWILKANVLFYYSIIPYRGEWRYAYDAHRVMMMDAGHVTENLYLACSALGLGTCAIAAVNEFIGSRLFDLDGKEEYAFYMAPVGTISEKNEAEEQAFYAFLKQES